MAYSQGVHTRLGEVGRAGGIALCGRCRRELLPKLAAPRIGREALRIPSAGMVKPVDPKADKRRRRKAERAHRRNFTRGTLGSVVKLLIRGRATVAEPPSDECPDCLALQRS